MRDITEPRMWPLADDTGRALLADKRPAGIKPTRRFLRNTRWRGERMLLPYLDDFLFMADSREAACALRTTRIDALLIDSLGKIRNPKKIHREQPNTQADKHLGLEMDLRWHEFRAPAEKLATLARMASSCLGRATSNRRWLPAREVAFFAVKARFLYLAIAPAVLPARVALSSVGHSA
eukprot:jgi/Tetstr1/464763/TSEL_009510.t1